MEAIKIINSAIGIFFLICYSYQIFYIPVSLVMQPHLLRPEKAHKFAILICARNEENVIPYLIDSIHNQTYRNDLVTIFVIADNCTDHTANAARSSGAVVYERENRTLVGKGYALNELLKHIGEDYPADAFDGYFVFDADNLLAPNFIEEMNKTFSDGYEIITSYRCSKNYDDNWISAGYSLWFLRESKYLNNARMLIGTSCSASGTGFFFSRKILEKCGGWNFFLLTEDIEFTIHNILNGERIGFCKNAIHYDEQPVTFKQSWTQRMRWAKGYIQVFKKYGADLIKSSLKGHFASIDMTLNIMPAVILTCFTILSNVALIIIEAVTGGNVIDVALSFLRLVGNMYLTLFFIGAVTTVSEWKQIHTSAFKKVFYTFTFPLFMMTYIPISCVALFKKVEWQPIEHTCSMSIDTIHDTNRIA